MQVPTEALEVHDDGLVKTVAFKDPKYVGDPINAVKIFNEKETDELAVFDIDATARGAEPNFKMIANLAVVARGTEPGAIWEMEDEELLAAVNWQLGELRSRRGSEVA